jgi:arsenical resistance protein ArsH
VAAVLPALGRAADFAPVGATRRDPLRVLVLYGTLRPAGFSKLLAYEVARLLEGMGADVRVYDPRGLPVRDPELSGDEKVCELRSLVEWSEAHAWVASELHGNLCSVLKNQVDWIPLNTASIRPTQGKAVAVFQVNGGSQSFNAVNTLRLLARWMRMPCVTNQSSVPKAWQEFGDDGRMKDSSLRERVVDVCEELYKFALVNREYADFFVDRYSERKEREEKGRLLTQAEKEAEKAAAAIKNKANE